MAELPGLGRVEARKVQQVHGAVMEVNEQVAQDGDGDEEGPRLAEVVEGGEEGGPCRSKVNLCHHGRHLDGEDDKSNRKQ